MRQDTLGDRRSNWMKNSKTRKKQAFGTVHLENNFHQYLAFWRKI